MLNICDICKKYFATTSSEYERRLAQSIPESELRAMRGDYEKMLAEEERERMQSLQNQHLVTRGNGNSKKVYLLGFYYLHLFAELVGISTFALTASITIKQNRG